MRLFILKDDDLKEENAELREELARAKKALREKDAHLAILRADCFAWETRARRMDQLYRAMIEQGYPMEE